MIAPEDVDEVSENPMGPVPVSPPQLATSAAKTESLARVDVVWLNTRGKLNTPGGELVCRDRSDVSLMS